MAIRRYLVPMIGDGVSSVPGGRLDEEGQVITTCNTRRPAYFHPQPLVVFCNYAAVDYGDELAMLVKADTTTAQHNSIIANANVFAFPVNPAANINANSLNTVLTALKIPTGWANGLTVAQAYNKLLTLFRFKSLCWHRGAGRFLSPANPDSAIDGTRRDLIKQQAIAFTEDAVAVNAALTLAGVLRVVLDKPARPYRNSL